MIQEIRLDSLEAISQFIIDQERNTDINRLRSPYYYRGLSNSAFHMDTSLNRNCKGKKHRLESIILSNFAEYASIEDPTLIESVWKQMIVGQHHGLPTRLLDWTHSPLIALHFADTEFDFDDLDQHDAVVWRIDARDVNRNLPILYQKALEKEGTLNFSVNCLQKVCGSIAQYDNDMRDNAFVMLEPPSVDQRIINQYSFFSVIPSEMTDIEAFLAEKSEKTVRYIIDKSIRWDLRDVLDQFNINERMIYPGLDGLSKWISRHYYVRG